MNDMKKRVLLKETEKMTAYQPANFFESQLIHARNKHLQQLLHTPVQPSRRLEEISRFGGVYFLDDSHSEDVESLYYSLEKIQHPVLWITGGDDSDVNYRSLLQLAVEKVKVLICIGEDNENLKRTFSPYIGTIYECKSMEHAVKTAYYSAEREDAVLLSSACACDALYADRKEQSDLFRKAISEL